MKVVVLGTKRDKILFIVKKSNHDLDVFLNELAHRLKDMGEVIFVPDKGVPMEVAEKVSSMGGRCTAVLPRNDEKYGISHIQLSEFADVEYPKETWYELNAEMATLGDIVVVVGLSGSVFIELSYIKYLRKFGIANPKVYLFKQWVSGVPLELMNDVSMELIESPSELK